MAKTWYDKYLRRYLRQIWGWSPERRAALNRARYTRVPKDLWKCEKCGTEGLGAKERDVNHINPCETIDGHFDGYGPLISRMLDVEADMLEVICKPCHKIITKEQNAKRRQNRKD